MGSKTRKWWKPAVAILLVAVVDAWLRQPPERLSSAKTVTLDTTKARPEEGHAYWISLRWIAPGLVSDKDGVSQLVLLDDGVELSARALHADIREEGGGLYSHWGDAILFSTRDGSDPRTNGRRYEVRVPPYIPSWHRLAQAGLLATALLVLLPWLHAMIGGSLVKTGLWVSGGAAALATLALASAFISSPARELRAIHDTLGQVPDDISPREESEQTNATTQKPRTRHLVQRGEVAAAFSTTAPAPVSRPPRTIVLHPSDGAQRPDGFIRLGESDALRNIEPLDIAATDLELLVLELEVARGDSLILQLKSFETPDTLRRSVELSFAVSPSPEPQIIRFQRPALAGMDRVHQVTIQRTPGVGRPPLVRVKSLRYSLRLDTFTAQHSGLDPVQFEGDLRPALWQSVSGGFLFPLEVQDGSLLKLAVGALIEDPKEMIDYAIAMVDSSGR